VTVGVLLLWPIMLIIVVDEDAIVVIELDMDAEELLEVEDRKVVALDIGLLLLFTSWSESSTKLTSITLWSPITDTLFVLLLAGSRFLLLLPSWDKDATLSNWGNRGGS